jgi:beta-xylosidase
MMLCVVFGCAPAQVLAQSLSQAWVADQGDGTYKNPVLDADYSDPDVVRVGNDYYMTASSFNAVPGLPLLHSTDLVNWRLVGHALPRQPPIEHFAVPRHGQGVWAPAIRHHRGEFYIYYGDPDFGIYLVKSRRIEGPWSEPVLVQAGKGMIDPCPLWDDDGNVYLVHAWPRSRVGFNSLLTVKRLSADGTKVIDDGVMVYDGGTVDPTIEGPKFYKRDGYYYISAPAGGVPTGWQTVLRSRTIYGPYERKVVIDQGGTPINGPHQGALLEGRNGESWFVHFQDKGPYGRVVHLQPAKWVDGWPVIGADADGDGKGEPVLSYRKPSVGGASSRMTPADSDEFDQPRLGLQWQWHANPQPTWAMPTNAGFLRLTSVPVPPQLKNAWDLPNLLLQKFPAEQFVATTRMTFRPDERIRGERAGLIVMGQSYASLTLRSVANGHQLVYAAVTDAPQGTVEREHVVDLLKQDTVLLRATVVSGAKVQFSYSLDGTRYVDVGESFQAQEGRWIGAKMGIYFTRPAGDTLSGFADFDWFRVTAPETTPE